MLTPGPLVAARPHDLPPLAAVGEDCRGIGPADQGVMDASRQPWLAERHALTVVTAPGARRQTEHPRLLLTACGRWRKRLETVGAPVTEHWAVTRIRVHDLWHYQHRLRRTILAHTGVVCLNLLMGRQPLDRDALVDA
jgi:hypothetical protein